ncbi:hypothetical protein IEQ34_004023 [Dendrobium chrysotoxum]|uniref:Uncharacterized protein n=1 Tax=Dendrobium chrysotoxum TaxID=161865 RepID=A0AAV7GY60_DENCH|nr:hypothetical protein IEQ34_004023 [Dendrobium chrysotoxum]
MRHRHRESSSTRCRSWRCVSWKKPFLPRPEDRTLGSDLPGRISERRMSGFWEDFLRRGWLGSRIWRRRSLGFEGLIGLGRRKGLVRMLDLRSHGGSWSSCSSSLLLGVGSKQEGEVRKSELSSCAFELLLAAIVGLGARESRQILEKWCA